MVDCVTGLLHILLKGERGQAYNIADPTSNITIKQLGEMIAAIGGKDLLVQVPEEKEKAGFNKVSKSTFSTHKLQDLGWALLDGNMDQKMRATIEEVQNLNQCI